MNRFPRFLLLKSVSSAVTVSSNADIAESWETFIFTKCSDNGAAFLGGEDFINCVGVLQIDVGRRLVSYRQVLMDLGRQELGRSPPQSFAMQTRLSNGDCLIGESPQLSVPASSKPPLHRNLDVD